MLKADWEALVSVFALSTGNRRELSYKCFSFILGEEDEEELGKESVAFHLFLFLKLNVFTKNLM